MPFLPNLSPTELVLIIGLAAFSGIAGGVAGYGTGALMPLVLVPIVGAAPVVPIIAVSAMFTPCSSANAVGETRIPRERSDTSPASFGGTTTYSV